MPLHPILTRVADDGFSDGSVSWLPLAISFALHVFLVGSFVFFAYGLLLLVRERKDQLVGRSMALFIGALVVVGAQASGTSYTDFVIEALGDSRFPIFGFFAGVMPAAAGLALGYYFTRGARKSSERAIRGMIMVGTFAITQFALMYAVAVDRSGREVDAAVTPNVAFVAGLGLWLVLNLGIRETPTTENQKGLGSSLARFLDRKGVADQVDAPLGRRSSSSTSRFHDN